MHPHQLQQDVTRHKVLVIDQNQGIRSSIQDMLSKGGFDFMEARDAAEGLQRLRQEKPKLILLDMLASAQSGWDFYQVLQRDPSLCTIPLVLMAERREDVTKTFPEPFQTFEYLEKPFNKRQLQTAIQHAITKSKRVDTANPPNSNSQPKPKNRLYQTLQNKVDQVLQKKSVDGTQLETLLMRISALEEKLSLSASVEQQLQQHITNLRTHINTLEAEFFAHSVQHYSLSEHDSAEMAQQLQKHYKLSQVELFFVQTFNENPKQMTQQAIPVSETRNSQTLRSLGEKVHIEFERVQRGKYWLMSERDRGYMFPGHRIAINEHNYVLLDEIFTCQNYTPGQAQKSFMLLKPAILRLLPDKQWRLETAGILKFYSEM